MKNVLLRLEEIADDHHANSADAALALEAMRTDLYDLIDLIENAYRPVLAANTVDEPDAY